MYKVDLHTHSSASPDGGLKPEQYHKALDAQLLDAIAITDHNRIDFAQALQQQLGERVIVGEEILTTEGEIIGLFMTQAVPPYLSPLDTIQQIKAQGGLVYIPHPFETVRKGLHPAVLDELIDYIDIIEVCNGRAFLQNRSTQAVLWARLNKIVGVASSDAHGWHGLGTTYTQVTEMPTAANLAYLLANGIPITDRPRWRSLLYPKYHRLRKKMRRRA